ncbi:hypothetical protein BGHDH14_bgh02786 [Blumeria hordei DH14]|uniref:ubiquitinyl hydrolase 1 n=1 Tax=Blumeria graminis f. sp. hordei (strain DH14) TaxID=546991 RepID=N1JFQ3_BLUG1|nr:hypothetical protein BGHDH14_bgh02786 [Blumeria hordei DH14]
MSDNWGPLIHAVRKIDQNNKFKLTFLLGVILFGERVDTDAINFLVAYAVSDKLKNLEPPIWSFYENFGKDDKLTLTKILKLIRSNDDFFDEIVSEKESQKFAKFLLKQWPCEEPVADNFDDADNFDVDELLNRIRPEWRRVYKNYDLSIYVSKVQIFIDEFNYPLKCFPDNCSEINQLGNKLLLEDTVRIKLPSISDLVMENISDMNSDGSYSEDLVMRYFFETYLQNLTYSGQSETLLKSKSTPEINELNKIISNKLLFRSDVENAYANNLLESLHALEEQGRKFQGNPEPNLDQINLLIDEARDTVNCRARNLDYLCYLVNPLRTEWLKSAGLWPCIQPASILETIRSISKFEFGENFKELIVEYAMSITRLQKLYRIRRAFLKRKTQALQEELENLGHTNWEPSQNPDWLLLEIDSNILIRPGQVDVANATIYPESAKNSVLQMNMGQGKTSCIMPMAAATLADGNNLMRVIVTHALLIQTTQLLQTRLGGLVGREIRHVPFSRKLSSISGISKKFREQLQYIQTSAGILIAQPDHILSFKLSGDQAILDGKFLEAGEMIEVQNFVAKNCRDVIDECDEILSVRNQLIYPSGTHKPIDGNPNRWEIIENLLEQVSFHLKTIETQNPGSVSITNKGSGNFPLFFFVNEESEEQLLSRLVEDVCSGYSQIITRFEPDHRNTIRDFISKSSIPDSTVKKVECLSETDPTFRKALYLLRGLLAYQVLIASLKKRWNVQYGLHPNREPLAVPYHAKGCPSENSEWGHQDVVIILTCLSFYYEGIKTDHLKEIFRHIRETGDPIQVYNQLTQDSNLPASLRNWGAITAEDEILLEEVWRFVHLDINIIKFYLNNCVFPRFLKQFEYRIQASSWDIPSMAWNHSEVVGIDSCPLTTGFSGTNDWKDLLPMTISQKDLPVLTCTNAEVLTYLLTNRNRTYHYAADSAGNRLTEFDLLKKVSDQNIKILLDAGAQIMELNNEDLVRSWLSIDEFALAAFYFDNNNRPRIMYRGGRKVPFEASPFVDNLGRCLVYLDQLHTRGTDLKFPPHARAALTLGPNQTKDHTVQAAMRMRQLGSTQSIEFFAPPEVHRSILNLQKIALGYKKITSFDVICWLLKQTCIGIENLLPCYSVQGFEFCQRTQAVQTYPKFFDPNSSDLKNYLRVIRHIEDYQLENLYGTKRTPKNFSSINKIPKIASFSQRLQEIDRIRQDSSGGHINSALQEVEQERQVANEVVNVRQVQIPTFYQPLKFLCLDKDLLYFVSNGIIKPDARGYELAFEYLAKTSIGRKYVFDQSATSQKLYISVEFGKTVQLVSHNRADHLYRPVHWILWSPHNKVAMVIIPEELELIMPLLRDGRSVVHLLSYAAPLTKEMLSFNDMNNLVVPPLPTTWEAPIWLRIELGILSGRLYFDSFEYTDILDYLGVQEQDGRIIEIHEDFPDLLALKSLPQAERRSHFTSEPLQFLQEWLSLRYNGQDFSHTPMGHICKGKALPVDFPYTSRLSNEDVNEAEPFIHTNVLNKRAEEEEEFFDESDFELLEYDNKENPANNYEEDLLNFSPSEDEDIDRISI